jgi:hypothetical protein
MDPPPEDDDEKSETDASMTGNFHQLHFYS